MTTTTTKGRASTLARVEDHRITIVVIIKKLPFFLEQALSEDKFNSQALVNKGNCLFLAGEVEKAREYYREAADHEADCLEAVYNLGIAYKHSGKIEEAFTAFHKIYRMMPTSQVYIYTHKLQVLPYMPSIDRSIKLLNERTKQRLQSSFLTPATRMRFSGSNLSIGRLVRSSEELEKGNSSSRRLQLKGPFRSRHTGEAWAGASISISFIDSVGFEDWFFEHLDRLGTER